MKRLRHVILVCVTLLLVTACWRDVTGWFSSSADTTSTTGTTAPATESASTAGSPSSAASPLPFGVTIGGDDAAVMPPLDQFGTFDGPVAANATISVAAKVDSVIINAFPCDANGNVASGAQPAIIVMQGTTGTLDATMDKKPLAPGTYMLNVVAGQLGTARLVMQVK
jgi:hypothetical protein